MPHFTYRDAPVESNVLSQGDVLRRTPEIDRVLKQYYPYFADNADNQFFLVITQSCDLVPRAAGLCAAKYIEIAAVRSIRHAVDREISTRALPDFGLPFAVAGLKARTKFDDFLRRLLNNNEPDYFFLRAEPTAGLAEHCCAFLQLTVPIKVEHYEACVEARILTLHTVFQAKLGWMVGQIYARVGTEDWNKDELTREVRSITSRAGCFWIDDQILKETREVVTRWNAGHPGGQLTQSELVKMLAEIPTKKSQALEHLKGLISNSNVVTRLTTSGDLTPDDLERLVNQIRSDQHFTSYFD